MCRWLSGETTRGCSSPRQIFHLCLFYYDKFCIQLQLLPHCRYYSTIKWMWFGMAWREEGWMERLDWVGPAHSSGGGGSHQGYPAYEGIGDCNTLVSEQESLPPTLHSILTRSSWRLDWVGPAHSSGGGGSQQGAGLPCLWTRYWWLYAKWTKNLSHQLCTPYHHGLCMNSYLDGSHHIA